MAEISIAGEILAVRQKLLSGGCMNTQNQDILRHMQSGRKISSAVAFNNYSITRLSARIHELRQQGYQIAAKAVKRRSKRSGRVTRYYLYYLEN